jgi:hypothetical protein
MNNGIKNKLKELIGKEVSLVFSDFGLRIFFPCLVKDTSHKVLRIEDDDCVVFGREGTEEYFSIEHVSHIIIKK